MHSQEYWRNALSLKDDIEIKDGILYVAKKSIALLIPSTIFGESANGSHYILGRNGAVPVDEKDEAGLYKALIKSGALCFGTSESIDKCKELLTTDNSSRTTSYLIAQGGTCEDVIQKTERINESRVLLVGCGGIGGLTAINLCGAGVKNLHIIDDDVIEKSNLNRQFLWKLSDIGKHKCKTLKTALNDRYKNLKITTTKKKASISLISDLAQKFNAVIITADEPLGIFDKIKKPNNCFFINSGYSHNYLYYSIRGNDKNPNPSCISWERNPWFIGPSSGPSNTELAGIVSALVLKHLSDPGLIPETIESAWNSSLFPRVPITTKTSHE